MDIETNERTVIRYEYGRPCCSKPLTKVNNVHILTMFSTRCSVNCLSVAAVVSLHCTTVTFRYLYQNGIDYEFVFRTNARTYVSKLVSGCISVLQLKFGETNTLCVYIY
jgi:hypothetical protein